MGTAIVTLLFLANIVSIVVLFVVLHKARTDKGKWFWIIREREPKNPTPIYGHQDENGVIWGLDEPPPDQQVASN